MEKAALEYSSLYKFLVSFGLFALVADGLFSWSMLQHSAVLEFPQRGLTSTTAIATAAVEAQQTILSGLIQNLPWISGVWAGVALVILVAGIFLWHPRQKVQDEIENNRLIDGVAKSSDKDQLISRLSDQIRDELVAVVGPIDSTAQFRLSRDWYIETEARITAVFSRAFQSTHIVETNMSLTKDRRSLSHVDILLTAREESGSSYVVEIKTSRAKLSSARINDALVVTGWSARNLAAFIGRPVFGIVFIVITDDNMSVDIDWAGWPVADGDPRNDATTLVIGLDVLERFETDPLELRRLVEL